MIKKIKEYWFSIKADRRDEIVVFTLVGFTMSIVALLFYLMIFDMENNKQTYIEQFNCPEGTVLTLQTAEPSCVPGFAAEKISLQVD